MDRGLIAAMCILALGVLLAVIVSSLGLMGFYNAKIFAIAGGALSLLVIIVTDRWRSGGG